MSRVPPNDLRAERAILGCALLDPGSVDEVADLLAAEDFYSSGNGLIWDAVLSVHSKGGTVDMVSLRGALADKGKLAAAGGDEYLLKLTDGLPSSVMAERHARRVADLASRRAMIAALQTATAEGYSCESDTSDYLDTAEALVHEAVAGRHRDESGPVHVWDCAEDALAELDIAMKGGRIGVHTGIPDFDEQVGGLHPGTLLVASGRPGMGKSAWAMGVTARVAPTQGPVVFFSLEMPRAECFRRLVCHEGRIDTKRARTGRMTRDEFAAYQPTIGTVTDWPIYFDDTPSITLSKVRSRARRLKAKAGGLAVIVVDYLQLMRAGFKCDSREGEISTISRELKALAKEMDCPIIALSQLNRKCEERADKRPMNSDLRESGAIEQDADTIVHFYRDEVYNPKTDDRGIVEMIVGKARGGATGTVKARWTPSYCRFDPLDGGYGYASGFSDAEAAE